MPLKPHRLAGLLVCLALLFVGVYWVWPAGANGPRITRDATPATLARGDRDHREAARDEAEPLPAEGPDGAATAGGPPAGEALPPDEAVRDDKAWDRPPEQAQGSASARTPEREEDRPPVVPPAFDVYTIKAGDTIERIARAFGGGARLAEAIQRENPLVSPTALRVGSTLRIPRDADATLRQQPPSPPAIDRTAEYTVQPGETFSQISAKVYGSARHWEHLFKANRDRVSNDPGKLRAGQVILVPPLPGGSS